MPFSTGAPGWRENRHDPGVDRAGEDLLDQRHDDAGGADRSLDGTELDARGADLTALHRRFDPALQADERDHQSSDRERSADHEPGALAAEVRDG
jgi:hypothetical protein